jgi:signal transduction histidine kinase
VEDDGPGIPPDKREAVFTPGLNIVREVTESHGYEIMLTESDAGGARFEIHRN